MFSYIWPIALVVLSNVVYQICAKSNYVTNKSGHPDLYDRPVFHQSLNINMSKNS